MKYLLFGVLNLGCCWFTLACYRDTVFQRRLLASRRLFMGNAWVQKHTRYASLAGFFALFMSGVNYGATCWNIWRWIHGA
jgi:hypothetical protein